MFCFAYRIQSPKKFRLEWQPGPAGYVRWYAFPPLLPCLHPTLPYPTLPMSSHTPPTSRCRSYPLSPYSAIGRVRYINGVFRFGIDATSLTPWGTKIPDEPSYVILNTAISTSWGFPNPPWGYVLRLTSRLVRRSVLFSVLLSLVHAGARSMTARPAKGRCDRYSHP